MRVTGALNRAFRRALPRVHVLDTRFRHDDAAVVPGPSLPAFARSVAKAAPMRVAGALNRAFGRALPVVHVLDTRCRRRRDAAVIPGPSLPALARSVAQAPSVAVAGALNRAFGRALPVVRVLDARFGRHKDAAVIPAPPRKALAESVAQAPSVAVAGGDHRAFGRALPVVRVLDARFGRHKDAAVLPAPLREALAGSVAQAPSVAVAGGEHRALGRAALRVHVRDARVCFRD